MQNKEIEKAIPWNPWHGCKKVSVGCKNCLFIKWIKDMEKMQASSLKEKQLMN